MAEPRRFSVWLPLEGLARARVSVLVGELAAAHGAPAFEPHVTVLGRVYGRPGGLVRTLHRLALVSAPFEVRLTDAAIEDAYHRALYVHAESPGLRTLRARAAAAFRVPDEEYRPHASLLYADLPAEAKEAIVDRIGRRLGLPFEARRLELWATDGEVEGWRRLAEAVLGAA